MKLITSILAMLFVVTSYSQVGVGVTSPKSDLHVSKSGSDGGSIQIDGGIRLGGDDNTPGEKGRAGQVIMSDGNKAEWVTLGKAGDYTTDCTVPNKIATINFTLQDGSSGNSVNVTSAQMTTALNTLPEGGIIVLRTNTATTYSQIMTRLTVELPSSTTVLNKPFVLAFDGPNGSNNSLKNGKTIEILVKANSADTNPIFYELSTVSSTRKFYMRKFSGTNSEYKVSELDNSSGATQPILLFNSYTIKAISDETWTFTTRDCYIQNPKN